MADGTTRDATTVAERPFGCLLILRGDAADDGFRAAVRDATGLEPPTAPGTTAESAGRALLWLGPDEWLLVDDSTASETILGPLRAALGDRHAAVTDVTGSRIRLMLTGAGAGDVMAAGCALDLHPRAFPTGRCARSTLAGVPVVLHRPSDADGFHLLVPVSYADWLSAWIADALPARSPET